MNTIFNNDIFYEVTRGVVNIGKQFTAIRCLGYSIYICTIYSMWTKPQQKIIVHVFLARNINVRTIYYDDFYPFENDQKHKIFA